MPTSLISRGPLGFGGAILAGVVSTAIFAVALAHAETLLVMVAYFTVLPLFLAGLGAGSLNGLAASLIGSAGLLLVQPPSTAIAYVIINALPAAILVALALRHHVTTEQQIEWYSEGNLLAIITLYPCFLFLLVFGLASGENGGLLTMTTKMLTEGTTQFKAQLDASMIDQFTLALNRLVRILPALAGCCWMFVTMLSMIAAQYILQQQNWNLRPGFTLTNLQIPQWLIMAAAATGLVGALAPAPYDYLGLNFCIMICVPFFFVGLAVIHAYAATKRFQMVILVILYVALSRLPWLALLVTVLGVVDQWANFRQRLIAKKPS